MSYHIRHFGTLAYYDGIQLFEGRSEIGGHYLCVLADNGDAGPAYAIVGLPPTQLQKFRLGLKDLRELMIERSRQGWLYGVLGEDERGSFIDPTNREDQIPETYLPDPGFFLNFAPPVSLERITKES